MQDNTLKSLSLAIESMVTTYGNCLLRDIEKSGLEDELADFIRSAVEIQEKIEEVTL